MRGGLVAVAVGALLAGCGGSGNAGPPAVPSATPGSPATAAVQVTSPDFLPGRAIPARFTCFEGGTVPPGLAWRDVPSGAASLALVVTDPDAPGGRFVHWVLYDLPARDGGLTGASLPAGSHQGDNSGGTPGWTAPCPPSGTHHYTFTVYALSGHLQGASTDELLSGLDRLTMARGSLTGLVTSR